MKLAPVILTVALSWLTTLNHKLFAGELEFTVHPVNPESEYSACAVLDVNEDGKLDIVCGGWWYAAPDWEKHFVMDVEVIRGRFDGYSHLPYDVNNDGRTDLINVNYRSQSIYWVENPGPTGNGWRKHTLALPGAMETGRLYDVDGDGDLDLLPNGIKFAAWWEIDEVPGDGGHMVKRWIQHDLPAEVGLHGIGFGDINGDGRGDIAGQKGWLETPTDDPRTGSWQWHPEYEMEKDASIPILVVDMDGDGDADLIYGRGHDYGLYWLEQTQEGGGARQWTKHEIDKSWSQAHTLLWEDLDGNGTPEIVTGKRYMAHDGKDPGAYEPLGIYRYEFDPAATEWNRHVISHHEKVGFCLDPKAADMDGDGDLDLVVSGRSGLYWLENRLK